MNTLILAQDFTVHSTGGLVAALEARGHQVLRVSPLDCTVSLEARGPLVWHQGQILAPPDLVLLRCASFRSFGRTVVRAFETAIAQQFQHQGVLCINEPQAKLVAHDKLLSLQVLHAAGLPIPETHLTWDPAQLEQLIEVQLGTPLVLKTQEGTWGVGVMKADTAAGALSVMETLQGMDQVVLAQRFVGEANNRDLRVIVIGEQAVGAFRRTARPGEFRANIHRGATPEMVTLPPVQASIAVAATQALGLELAGVDLLETETGPMVLEVNPSPGWKQIELLSDIDVAGEMAAYLESRLAGR